MFSRSTRLYPRGVALHPRGAMLSSRRPTLHSRGPPLQPLQRGSSEVQQASSGVQRQRKKAHTLPKSKRLYKKRHLCASPGVQVPPKGVDLSLSGTRQASSGRHRRTLGVRVPGSDGARPSSRAARPQWWSEGREPRVARKGLGLQVGR